jgi:hypothetical protein
LSSSSKDDMNVLVSLKLESFMMFDLVIISSYWHFFFHNLRQQEGVGCVLH